ncbi:MAG: ABC transporter ATP-binding protein/permease [Deltaproteobacteria bacterium]|nr:ABC transporter ATP-binding protein/permease [Deltaproteobacteria bacterium]
MTASTSKIEPADAPGAVPGTRKHFLRQVLRLAGPYWKCERRGKVRFATLSLLLLTVAQVGLTVWGNYWNRALFDALEQRSVRGVLVQVAVFVLIFVISIVVTGAHLLVKRWLQLDWRAWLTDQLTGRWMEEGRHYRLLFSAGEHDNPDQRIAEDIRIATESAIALAHSLVFSLLILGMFIDILWSVSGSIVVPGTDVQVPGYMVPLAFVYAALGSAFGWMIGRPLVRSTNALQAAEATFRFGLSRVREHSDAIALIHGEPMERTGSAVRFRQVVREWNRQSLAYLGLVSFGTGYGALLPVFPLLVAAPQYIAGAMSLGVLMQAAQAFQRLTSALSWPVDNIGEIARCRASAERVLSLDEAIHRMDATVRERGGPRIVLDRSDRARLAIEDLSIADPSGEILLEHFSAEIHRGERVLITGHPVVTGGLFKVIGGLWPLGSGRVVLPGDGEMLFVPQRPFLPEGTLREVLCYPCPPEAFTDDDIRQAMACAGIAWIAPRLDERDDWEQVLSRRAQQRIGFTRVLLQRPAWVFMEEATDAFEPEGERLILEMLRGELPDTTLVTITFRFHQGLEKLHDRTLELERGPKPTSRLNVPLRNGDAPL